MFSLNTDFIPPYPLTWNRHLSLFHTIGVIRSRLLWRSELIIKTCLYVIFAVLLPLLWRHGESRKPNTSAPRIRRIHSRDWRGERCCWDEGLCCYRKTPPRLPSFQALTPAQSSEAVGRLDGLHPCQSERSVN